MSSAGSTHDTFCACETQRVACPQTVSVCLRAVCVVHVQFRAARARGHSTARRRPGMMPRCATHAVVL
eukprot:5652470-Alexandrium_andersonii.AAC.1